MNNKVEVAKFINFLTSGNFSKNTILTQIREKNNCENSYDCEIRLYLDCEKTKQYNEFDITYNYTMKKSSNYVNTDSRTDYWCNDIDNENVEVISISDLYDEDGQELLKLDQKEETQIIKLLTKIINK